jgi:hypothetical protein
MNGGSVAVAIAKVLIVRPAGSLAAQFTGGGFPTFALLVRLRGVLGNSAPQPPRGTGKAYKGKNMTSAPGGLLIWRRRGECLRAAPAVRCSSSFIFFR